MKSVTELKKEIENEYSWFLNNNNKAPNIAYVKCQWDDDDEVDDLVQTIVIDGNWQDGLVAENFGNNVVPFIYDEEVLYYCSSIYNLLDLLVHNGVSDFKVVDFIGFEYLE